MSKLPAIGIRLTDDEKAIWQDAAAKDNMDQLGTWIKKVIRDHIKNQGDRTK